MDISETYKKPTLKVIHIAKSLEKVHRTIQNLSISMPLPTLLKTKYDRTTKAHSAYRN